MSKNRIEQIKYYQSLLKDNEFLLLKSQDCFFKSHYIGSPLEVLTGFKGSAGEAVIEKNGKITIFVDPRYHLLVEKQVYKDIEIYKQNLGETFFEALKNKYKKGTVLFVSSDISLKEYLKLDSYFDLRKYELNEKYLTNKDYNKKAPIFEVNKEIEPHDFNFKIKKIKHSNGKMLIFNPDIISYLTNLRSFAHKFSSNFKSVLYLDFKNNKNVLFVENPNQLKNISIENLEVKKLDELKDFTLAFDDEIEIDPNDINLSQFVAIKKPKMIKKTNLDIISTIKPKSVIEHLKEANKKLDLALFDFKKRLKEGLSEFELVEIFENELVKKGAVCPSFKTILAINENSASIHYSSYDKTKILKNESLFLLDCGGYYEAGYATDITRTFYFGSNPKPIYKKIYTNVLKAFIACFLSNDTEAKNLDSLARSILDPFQKEGFFFNHGLGHGIGTSVHQNPPCLVYNSKDIIKPYQVHSIEPGLYGKDNEGREFGVRIENCVYTDINFKRHSLTKFPFEEILIDYNILNNKEKEFVENWNRKEN